VCNFTITPLTRPASEFQLTWSPTLNGFAIMVLANDTQEQRMPRR